MRELSLQEINLFGGASGGWSVYDIEYACGYGVGYAMNVIGTGAAYGNSMAANAYARGDIWS